MTDKIDFKKTLDAYQARRGRFRIVDVPDMQYLMIDGHGDPNTAPAFTEAVQALYPVAYKLKFASRRELGRDYVVPPLEGLWWANDMDSFTAARDKSQWDWTLMIMAPDWIDQATFTTAAEQAGAKNRPARLDDVHLDTLSERRCVQTLHVGSFDDEAEVLARLHHEFIPDNGLHMAGKHHEIYLSDSLGSQPRSSAPSSANRSCLPHSNPPPVPVTYVEYQRLVATATIAREPQGPPTTRHDVSLGRRSLLPPNAGSRRALSLAARSTTLPQHR